MKRICVDKGIFLKVNDSGKVCKNCFEVSVKTYTENMNEAIMIRNQVNSVVGVWKNERR